MPQKLLISASPSTASQLFSYDFDLFLKESGLNLEAWNKLTDYEQGVHILRVLDKAQEQPVWRINNVEIK